MKNKSTTLIVGVVGALALGAFFLFGGNTGTRTVQRESNGMPVFTVDTKKIELGEVALQGDYPAEFIVTNTGDAPLEISEVKTSCMCTFVELVIDGETSPEFNMVMHNSNALRKWKSAIASGASATVRVTYKPYLMPVQGPIERSAIFATNDTNNPEVQLVVSATVK